MVRGAELALAEVRDTSAVLVWPARMTWVGPETVTSLIEAHGTHAGDDPAAGLGRDAGLAGARAGRERWARSRDVPADRMPPDVIDELAAAVPTRIVEVGDPGVVHDADTPFADLPPYDGPPDPPAGHTHEWGDGVEEDGVDEGVPGEGRGSRRSRRPRTTSGRRPGLRPALLDGRDRPRPRAAQPVPQPRQRHRRDRDPADDQGHAGELRDRRPLAEQHDAQAHGQRPAGRAG